LRRTRHLRLALAALVTVGLTPGTWLRSPLPPLNQEHALRITKLPTPVWRSGGLELLGAWRLQSPNSRFGGYSGLVVLGDGRLLAGGDRGDMLVFSPPDTPERAFVLDRFGYFDGSPWGLEDLEALTRDPASGRLWAAYEVDNQILRLDADFRNRVLVRPRVMHRWLADYGPEAMARLADGKFVVLAEASRKWFVGTTPGVIFSQDPEDGGLPLTFRFERPDGYRPTDIAQLPDGRVLILLRTFRLGLPPRFPGKIAIADPALIRAGGVWQAKVLTDLDTPLPSDNFEGLAVVPQRDGGAVVWVISDDNRSPLQRTLLLKFRWAPTQKARGSPARP
jgi:hypothetical protein